MLFGRKDKIDLGSLKLRRSWHVNPDGELQAKIEVTAGASKPGKKASKRRRSRVPRGSPR